MKTKRSNKIINTLLMLCATMSLYVGVVQDTHADAVVFEDVGFISGIDDSVVTPFEISVTGSYQATLTDFVFPGGFDTFGFNVTSSTEEFGRLSDSGSFIFEATPGLYFANVYGISGGPINLGLYGVEIMNVNGEVAPVPLPAPILLLLSSLVALVAFGRGGKLGRIPDKEDYSLQPA